LKYVERKQSAADKKNSLASAEAKLSEFNAKEEEKSKAVIEKNAQQTTYAGQFTRFLESLGSNYTTKADAMKAVCDFIEESLSVPAAYIGVKKVVGEQETLNYLSAGPSQGHVIGKKMNKVVVDPDAEDAPQRQGVSFDAFKIPEVPEEEPQEESEDAPKVVKPPPVATPLFIENTMRDKRCKFFGIPKLGSFVAIPFSYQSSDFEGGCALGAPSSEAAAEPPAEGEAAAAAPAAAYAVNKVKAEFIIGIDSIGNYRLFQVKFPRLQLFQNIGE
jgi:hypothetical protein